MVQTIVVALLVTACVVYATWTLMPAAGRRAGARALLRLKAPAWLRGWLGKHAAASSGCGCDGCDKAPGAPKLRSADAAATSTAAVTPQPIRIHRRVTR